MKVLGFIMAFNDAEVIDRAVKALLGQTYPLKEILLVDNASTDGTSARSFPEAVTVIRHPENRGTAGAVTTGFQYALNKKYDWIWIIDADSAPRRDALEKLLCLYKTFTPGVQAQTRLVASLPVECSDQKPNHGIVFSPTKMMDQVRPEPGQEYYECDVAMWSGSLFRLEAVRQIGFPSADYFADWVEIEYGYRGKRYGYKTFVCLGSIVEHNIGGQSMTFTSYRFGPLSLRMFEFSPLRCYYETRNRLYFSSYEFKDGGIVVVRRALVFAIRFMLNFLLRPTTHKKQILACLRGIWDGIFKNMHHRY
jgi:rhamnopyranosyl-N-acetylglucosaminyl-diphospho-decaprenol beta-1,3/1,4-galactofuranosyltransferase